MGKRMRRAYLKRFSSTVVGGTSSIDKHYFREAANRAHALSHKDIAFTRTFGFEGKNKPRQEVLEALSKLTTQSNPEQMICLVPQRVYLLWNDNYVYHFIKFNVKNKTLVNSYNYSSREQAMFAFNNGMVKYKD